MVARAFSRSSMGRQRGFTYVWVLATVAVISIGLLATAEMWVTSARSQRLAELEWTGGEFTRAIGSYYESTPGAVKSYPKRLQDLLEDRRYLTVRRHLRTIYRNPWSGKSDWEAIVSPNDGICGVRVAVSSNNEKIIFEFVYQPEMVSR